MLEVLVQALPTASIEKEINTPPSLNLATLRRNH